MHGGAGNGVRGSERSQSQAGILDDTSKLVAHGLDPEHTSVRLHRAGAQFRAAQVHQDAHRASDRPRCAAYVIGHRGPRRRFIMRAIDARDVHAGGDELMHQSVVLPRFGRQGHHDAYGAAPRRVAEQGCRVLIEQAAAAVDASRFLVRSFHPGLSGQTVQNSQYLVEIGEDMGFRVSQRGKPQPGQFFLQGATIALAQYEIVNQITRARQVIGGYTGQLLAKSLFGGQHLLAQRPQLFDHGLADLLIPIACGRRAGLIDSRWRFCGKGIRFSPTRDQIVIHRARSPRQAVVRVVSLPA